MVILDGSQGEGGGQILRTALALSLVTGQPFRIEKIRARRPSPGLKRQHLAAVRAAAEVGGAALEGAEIGSSTLCFSPWAVRPGEYRFAVGTAGSATLVLQTVLPPLLLAPGPSVLRIEGGTHNMHAPPFDFLEKAFLPILNRMGPRVTARLVRHGFYPAGGGEISVSIQPGTLRPIELVERGRVVRGVVRAIVSHLPRHIAQREAETIRRHLAWPSEAVAVEEVDSPGPGNVVLAELVSEHVTEVFAGFGQRGVSAEKVGAGVARQVRRYLEAGVPIGEHLADQLLVPMALARGGTFRTLAPSSHTQTNLETLGKFLEVHATLEEHGKDIWQVTMAETPRR
jgi:RNA 3'-terminal phosphate cyclase (ATP)